jgi:hypothetical protein
MLIPVKRYGCPFSVSFVPLRVTNPELGFVVGDGAVVEVGVDAAVGVEDPEEPVAGEPDEPDDVERVLVGEVSPNG